MAYTLSKILVWLVLASVLGAVIGWIAHSLYRSSPAPQPVVASDGPVEIERRASRGRRADDMVRDVDRGEVEDLWSRVATLEPAAQERDRLHRELATLRATAPTAAAVAAEGPDRSEENARLRAERDALQALVHRHEATLGIQAATIDQLQRKLDASPANTPPPPDVEAGAAVLGRVVTLDDLTLVRGIDSDVEDLCHQHGVTTWWTLATTPVATLQMMLDEAEPEQQLLDPSSWPTQARLLAHGSWQQFKNLTDRLPTTDQ